MPDPSFYNELGVGATTELNLRVSIATLARVIFKHPHNGDVMLALERQATLLEKGGERSVQVQAQPFGGAIRIHNPKALQNLIGNFHFDAEPSRTEQDFRLFIRPTDWPLVKDVCLHHWNDTDESILESNPRRELTEEFAQALGVTIQPVQYSSRPVGTVIENRPSTTDNFYAREFLTVRMYFIFEVTILDGSLVTALLMNNARCSNDDLRKNAWEDAKNGGNGWANASLTLPLQQVTAFYQTLLPEERDHLAAFQGHQLDETVAAALDHVMVPKYEKSFP